MLRSQKHFADSFAFSPEALAIPSRPAPPVGTEAVISGTNGPDTLTGTSGDDFFNLTQGGNDTASGLGGNDQFAFGPTFTAGDRVDGGNGYDALLIGGRNYTGTHAVTFGVHTMVNVEEIDVDQHYNYDLTTNNATVAKGKNLVVNLELQAGHTGVFDGSAETNGSFTVNALDGTYTLTGGHGDDDFNFKGGFTAADKIDGGPNDETATALVAGDSLNLNGDYSAGLVFNASTMTNIEELSFHYGHSYKVTLADGNVGAGDSLYVSGSSLGSADTLWFDGSAETDGHYLINGGAGKDTLIGGQKNDTIFGGGGADHITPGPGFDTIGFYGASDSTGVNYDTVTGFNFLQDKFELDFTGAVAPTGIDAAVGGTLSKATFDSDVAAAVTAAHLSAHLAVLFEPDAGGLSGSTFLIVDINGTPGYQAGQDLVIKLVNSAHLDKIGGADFTTA